MKIYERNITITHVTRWLLRPQKYERHTSNSGLRDQSSPVETNACICDEQLSRRLNVKMNFDAGKFISETESRTLITFESPGPMINFNRLVIDRSAIVQRFVTALLRCQICINYTSLVLSAFYS